MARSKKSSTAQSDEPTIHEATCVAGGGVVKGAVISEQDAVKHRQNDGDVVVCGPSLRKNRAMARMIEQQASGTYEMHQPHTETAGQDALPHFQPKPRNGREGHTFYETPNRKAK